MLIFKISILIFTLRNILPDISWFQLELFCQ